MRQGGILSPYMFNLYLDTLSDALNAVDIGRQLNCVLTNHFIYHSLRSEDVAPGRRLGRSAILDPSIQTLFDIFHPEFARPGLLVVIGG